MSKIAVIRDFRCVYIFDSEDERFTSVSSKQIKGSPVKFVDITDPLEPEELAECPQEILAHVARVREEKPEVAAKLFNGTGLPVLDIASPPNPNRAGERGPRDKGEPETDDE